MKSLLILLALFTVIASCNLLSNEAKPPKQVYDPFEDERKNFNEDETKWLKKLSEWDAARYNDSAKWRVFCYYGDDTCTKGTKNRELPPVPLGYLDLKLVFALYKKDTLDLLYSFMYDDSTEVFYTNNRSKEIFDRYQGGYGVSFNTKTDMVIGYIMGNGTFWERGPLVRYENFTHPNLIQFINQSYSRLDPWFRNEAIRRQLIKHQ